MNQVARIIKDLLIEEESRNLSAKSVEVLIRKVSSIKKYFHYLTFREVEGAKNVKVDLWKRALTGYTMKAFKFLAKVAKHEFHLSVQISSSL